MTDNATEKAISDFFEQRGKTVLDKNFDLFENEFIDSMELLELILHLETELGISVAQNLMSVDNFRSVARIASTVSGS